MPNQPIGRNSKCPCGSGKKYKHCCIKKGYEFVQDEQGTIHRSVPMPDETKDLLASHLEELSESLGRELTDDDAVFPGLHQEHLEHHLATGMERAGIDPAIQHAVLETGLLVSEENQHLISEEDLSKWQAAIDDYRRRHSASNVDYLQGSAAGQVDDEPTPQDAAALTELLQGIDPESAEQLFDLVQQTESAEEFANLVLVGPCIDCESENTCDCEEHPEIGDPCIGQCKDCGQLWCCDCDETFENAAAARTHECPFWESMEASSDESF